MHRSSKDTKPHARRYTLLEKDICCFEYLTSGNAHYKYLAANSLTMTTKTIQRHIQTNSTHIREGIIDAIGLKEYLVRNKFPLRVVLCEDATKVTAAVEFDYKQDTLRGLVSPLNDNGLSDPTFFAATSPFKMRDDIKKYALGEYAYVQLALPLATDAAPYVLYHVCSDNRFEFKDVLKRWQHTEEMLREVDITVAANASDGDPRLLKAMKVRAGLEQDAISSRWGPWFRVHDEPNVPFNVQDMVHCVNKFRNRLFNCDLEIGTCK